MPAFMLFCTVKVAIAGTGAMASLFAARLLPHVSKLHMFGTWGERIEVIRRDGLIVEELDGTKQALKLQISPYKPDGIFDVVLVLVKSFQTEGVGEAIANAGMLGPHTQVVSLQNGMGNLEKLQQYLSADSIMLGTTTQAALTINLNTVRDTGTGYVTLGAAAGEFPTIEDLFRKAGFETRCEADILSLLWGKLVINASVNIVSALLGQASGQILVHDASRTLLSKLAAEAEQIAYACGILLPYVNAVSEVLAVVEKSAANKTSTLMDVLQGRPTELPDINGYLIAQAEAQGIPCRLHRMVFDYFQRQYPGFEPGLAQLEFMKTVI